MVTAGANRVLSMAMHSPQVHGFFSIPVDHLHALNELADHFRKYDLSNTVAVSPDLGNAKETAHFARLLGVGVAVAAKQRYADDQVRISSIIGDVTGKDVIVLDDEIAKGSTMFELLSHLRAHKVKSIRIACTHGLFASGSAQRLSDQPDILEIVCTNTVPITQDKRAPSSLFCPLPSLWPRRSAEFTTANPSARSFTRPDTSPVIWSGVSGTAQSPRRKTASRPGHSDHA